MATGNVGEHSMKCHLHTLSGDPPLFGVNRDGHLVGGLLNISILLFPLGIRDHRPSKQSLDHGSLHRCCRFLPEPGLFF